MISTNLVPESVTRYDATTAYATCAEVCVFYKETNEDLIPMMKYESLEDANIGNYPPDYSNPQDSPKWKFLGGELRWMWADTYRSTVMMATNGEPTNPGEIDITIDVSNCDCVGLFGIIGTSLKFTLSHGGTTDDTETVTLTAAPADGSAYAALAGDNIYQHNYVHDFDIYGSSELRIQVIHSSDLAGVSSILPGRSFEVGDTKYGIEKGGTDYSIKQYDEDGNARLIPKAWVEYMNLSVVVLGSNVDATERVLSAVRGRTAIYDANNTYPGDESKILLGHWHDQNINSVTHQFSMLSLELKATN